ncbi:MAG: HAD family hydrolase [Acidobacteria bacterium]|nr:HAD family hydrolase [Acidobacteriota bacterium]
MNPQSAPARPWRAVILDMDGTLIDSNAAHVHAWVEALREGGYEVSEDDIWPLVGMGGDNLLPAAVGVDKDSAEGKKLSERRGEIFRERYLPHLKPFPQVRPLLERMRRDGLRLMVASSSPKDELQCSLELAGVADLVEGASSGSDGGRSKPDPDVVEAALKKLGLAADEVVMLGDTPYDVQAAAKVNVPVIAFRCGGFRDEDLKGAIALYDDATDLLAHYDESPLAGSEGPD